MFCSMIVVWDNYRGNLTKTGELVLCSVLMSRDGMLSSEIDTTSSPTVDTKSLPNNPISLEMEATVKILCSIDGIEFRCCIWKLPNGWIEDGSKMCVFRVIIGTGVRE